LGSDESAEFTIDCGNDKLLMGCSIDELLIESGGDGLLTDSIIK
jgi:hypothetical protein